MSAFVQARLTPIDLPEEIVGSRVVEQIETLFFAVIKLRRPISHLFKTSGNAQRGERTNQRCTGHYQACDERSDSALLRSVDQSIPPKNIEVGHAVHMSRVDLSSGRIDEVILDEERIPGVDEIDREIIPDLKVTIQSKEPLEATVHGVVESDGIETVVGSLSKEVLVVVCGNVHRLAKAWGSLVRSSTTSAEKEAAG